MSSDSESVGGVVDSWGVMEVPSRFEIDDELWAEVEPLIPVRQRRRRYPGRKAISDRLVLNGILHVLHTGIAWEDLPQEYGYGSGVTAWRRLRDWQRAGVWDALHQQLLAKLNAAGAIDWSRAAVDGSHVDRSHTGSKTICWSTRPASRWPSH
jgi:transposase